MQKLWIIMTAATLWAGVVNAQVLIDPARIATCPAIVDTAERLECYESSVLNRADLIASQPQVVATPETVTPYVPTDLSQWASNTNLPAETRLAAQVLGSPERTLLGNYPIAVVDSETDELKSPPSSPLESFMVAMSDDAVDAARYTRDFYFSLPNAEGSSELAILGFSCQSNITNMHIHLAKPVFEQTIEVDFTTMDEETGAVETLKQIDRVSANGFIISMPAGLDGIRLIKTLANDERLDIDFNRNNEQVHLVFNTKHLNVPLKILARQCSWQL